MNDVILKLLELVVMVSVIIITRYLIPWIRSNISFSQYSVVLSIVDAAVMYAEQTMTGGQIKKEAVMDLVTNELNKRGIEITVEQVNALVEAAVYSMNQEKAN